MFDFIIWRNICYYKDETYIWSSVISTERENTYIGWRWVVCLDEDSASQNEGRFYCLNLNSFFGGEGNGKFGMDSQCKLSLYNLPNLVFVCVRAVCHLSSIQTSHHWDVWIESRWIKTVWRLTSAWRMLTDWRRLCVFTLVMCHKSCVPSWRSLCRSWSLWVTG